MHNMKNDQISFKNLAVFKILEDNFSPKRRLFFKLGFTLLKSDQPIRGIELQQKEGQKRLKHT